MGIREPSDAHPDFPLPHHRIALLDPILKLGAHQYRILVAQIVEGLGR
jgi:hypothetical protein